MIDIILKYPKAVLIVLFLIIGLLGWQVRHFQIDASADTLLTKNNEYYIQTQVMNRRFPSQEFLLVAYEPEGESVFSEKTFADLKSLSGELRQLDRVESVRSIIDVPLVTLMDNGLAGGDPSEWTIEKKNFSVERLRETFKGHPVYEGLLVNERQTATSVQVLFRENEELNNIYSQIVDLQQKALHNELPEDDMEKLVRLNERAESLEKELNRIRVEEIQEIRRIVSGYEDDA
ncbi:MAG TPA: RND family transporter, partial [Gammaproteobacteria bacterium]